MTAFIHGYSNRLVLTDLWRDAFGDSLIFLDKMHENGFFTPDHTYVLTDDGKLVSALCALDYPMSFRGKSLRMAYICNAATATEARHNGHMGNLLEKTCNLLKQKGYDAVTVIPATEDLFGYYAIHGFETAFYLAKHRYENNENAVSELRVQRLQTGTRALYDMYRKQYAHLDFACYKSLTRFNQAIDEYAVSPDSGFYGIGGGFAFLTKGEEEITVREFGGIDEETLANALVAHYHRDVVVETFPEDSKTPVGMIRFLKADLELEKDELGYMNCMLN